MESDGDLQSVYQDEEDLITGREKFRSKDLVLQWSKGVWLTSHDVYYSREFGQTDELLVKRSRKNRASLKVKSGPFETDSGSLTSPTIHLNHNSSTVGLSPSTKKPLIDLNQPTDPDGRPLPSPQPKFLYGKPSGVSDIERSSGHGDRLDELEERHRMAIRRLQAEAVEQLEQAEWEAYQRSRSRLSFSTPSPHRVLELDRSPTRGTKRFFRKLKTTVYPPSPSSPPPPISNGRLYRISSFAKLSSFSKLPYRGSQSGMIKDQSRRLKDQLGGMLRKIVGTVGLMGSGSSSREYSSISTATQEVQRSRTNSSSSQDHLRL